MAKRPDAGCRAWEDRQGPVILAAVDRKGNPYAIYATCVGKPVDEQLIVADHYFSKTRANIEAGSKGALLPITKSGEAYQAKGAVRRHTSGPHFEGVRTWFDPQMPGHAATVLSVEEVHCGGERLLWRGQSIAPALAGAGRALRHSSLWVPAD